MKGYVYVLHSPAMRDNIYKIGMTRRSPEERSKELSRGTGVALPFEVVYSQYFADCVEAEKVVHEELKAHRFNQDREFFDVELRDAINAIDQVVIRELREENEELQKKKKQLLRENKQLKTEIASSQEHPDPLQSKLSVPFWFAFDRAERAGIAALESLKFKPGEETVLGWGHFIFKPNSNPYFCQWLKDSQSKLYFYFREEELMLDILELENKEGNKTADEIHLPIPYFNFYEKRTFAAAFAVMLRRHSIYCGYSIFQSSQTISIQATQKT